MTMLEFPQTKKTRDPGREEGWRSPDCARARRRRRRRGNEVLEIERQCRDGFAQFLRTHRGLARRLPLPELIDRSNVPISPSSAYRVAVQLDVRGKRKNQSRLAEFWRTINWKLPDSVLAFVWHCERGNIQSKRKLDKIGPPRWNVSNDRHTPAFQNALRRELLKSQHYRGPKPSY